MDPKQMILDGTYARLDPLELFHAEDLYAVGNDERIWQYMPRPKLASVADAQQWIEQAKASASDGS